MRVVVLDGDALHPVARQRVGGRQVVRVQVVRDDLRRHREQPLEVRDAVLERAERLGVLEVADVVRDPGAAAAGQAERALELGPAGKHVAGGGHRQREHARHRAARPAQRQRPPARDPQHRVVGARLDRPVVEHERVGDGVQPLERVVVLVGDRLVGDVAAGHHQRLADVGQQQVVQRAVRQHHAELGRERRDRGRHPRSRPPRREDDRPVAAAQQRRLDASRPDELVRRVDVARHQRERLLLAVLARPQLGDRSLVGGQAGEVEPTDPLHRDDPTGLQDRHRRQGVDPPGAGASWKSGKGV